MEEILKKIETLEKRHNKPDPKLISKKDIKLGLRNVDGTGVVVGITSKGQVKGHNKTDAGIEPAHGQLSYCGYNIYDLVENIEKEKRFGFDEITYLLLTGELPSEEDLNTFSTMVSKGMSLTHKEKEKIRIIQSSENCSVMNTLRTAVSSMSGCDSNPDSIELKNVTLQCVKLIAKFPTIITYIYNIKHGRNLFEPKDELSTAENFLYMLNGTIPDEFTSHLFDLMLILHVEHGGGNNSTFTVRTVSSSGANTYAAIAAGLGSLGGHLHGGANEAVMRMIDDIKANVNDWNSDEEIRAYLIKILEKRAGDRSGKIYGIGHAVYTLSDPRALIIEKKLGQLADKLGKTKEYALYKKIATIATQIIREKKGKFVSPNIDFYSGFLYDMIGIPTELFTPVFAMARVVGWSAHRIEQLIQGRIIRPAYVSSLKEERKYVPLSKRA
jgi:citrate synthase